MKLYSLFLVFLLPLWLSAQAKREYEVRTIAFYNVENLFDIYNDTLAFDDDRTPEGKDRWTQERYQHKITQTSKVISEIGREITRSAPDIIGLCEIENKQVVEDLIASEMLRKNTYGIIHFDSPDERGIDVALLFKKNAFNVHTFKSHRLLLYNEEGFRDYTRDQLVVGGILDNEAFYFIVNHWPSRSGGESRSRPFRLAAAKLNKRIIDSLHKVDIQAKIISMGDFNDDPTSDSFKKILRTKGKTKKIDSLNLINPMEKIFKKGYGSLAYRDKWNLFDQFYFSSNLLNLNSQEFRFWKAGIYNPNYLITQNGKYEGYPLRTYAGGSYLGGYSDHFPVFMYLIRESTSRTPPKEGN